MADRIKQLNVKPPYDEFELDHSMSQAEVMNWVVGRLNLKRTKSVELFLCEKDVGSEAVTYFRARVWKVDV